MKRFKLLLENFLVYGIGGIFNKLIPFIMLPLVTRLMPDTFYFGLNDLSNTVVSFGSAIAIMGMYDAMFRMFFEKDDKDYKINICSSALAFTIVTSIIVTALLVIFRRQFAVLFFSGAQYENLVLLSAMSILIGTTNSIVAAPTRMQNKRKIYLAANIISPVLSYSISIPLLLKGYFLTALPLAAVISALVTEVFFWTVNREWFNLKRVEWDKIKQMLVIAVPLMPNFIIYWVFNSSDRLMIAKILGNEYTGIYSIGSKMGHISQLIYTAFAGGWQYFSFHTMKDSDQVHMTSKIFEYLGAISFCAGIGVTALAEPVFQLLFTGEYVQGYIVVPYLFLAPLIQMLFQTIGNQFLIVKKTWPSMLILASGALVNVLINFYLIPVLGIEGAAIATLIGYLVSVAAAIIVLERMKLIHISLRFYVISLLTIVYYVLWRMWIKEILAVSLIAALIFIVGFAFLYRSELKMIIDMVKNRKQTGEKE